MPTQSPLETKVDPRRYFESADKTRSDTAAAQAGLRLSGDDQSLQSAVHDLSAHLRGARAAGRHELGAVHLDRRPDSRTSQRAVLHGVGEPMLVKNLPKMVRYLKDRGTYVLFNTNGTVLNERNGRALIDAGLDELRVSLDAANAQVLSGGSRQGLLQPHPQATSAPSAICRSAKARIGRGSRPGSPDSKETIAELPAFVQVAADIGVEEVYLQRLVFFESDAIGLARPDQALYEQMTHDEAAHLEEATALARSLWA